MPPPLRFELAALFSEYLDVVCFLRFFSSLPRGDLSPGSTHSEILNCFFVYFISFPDWPLHSDFTPQFPNLTFNSKHTTPYICIDFVLSFVVLDIFGGVSPFCTGQGLLCAYTCLSVVFYFYILFVSEFWSSIDCRSPCPPLCPPTCRAISPPFGFPCGPSQSCLHFQLRLENLSPFLFQIHLLVPSTFSCPTLHPFAIFLVFGFFLWPNPLCDSF